MFRDSEKNKSIRHHVDHAGSNSACNPDFLEEASTMSAFNRPKRILTVDDDRTILDLLSKLLTALKFEVKKADNAYDALDLFVNERFEMVLSDIQMPGMDGWELAFNIKKTSPETPVILMTGMEKERVQKRMKSGHADFVLYKPFSLNQLKTIVCNFKVQEMNRTADLR